MMRATVATAVSSTAVNMTMMMVMATKKQPAAHAVKSICHNVTDAHTHDDALKIDICVLMCQPTRPKHVWQSIIRQRYRGQKIRAHILMYMRASYITSGTFQRYLAPSILNN